MTDQQNDRPKATDRPTGGNARATLPKHRPEDLENDVEGMTRRGTLRATAGLLAGPTLLGGLAAACHDSDDDRGDVPTSAMHFRSEISLGVSGMAMSANDGGEAHTLHVARGYEGEWTHDEIDLIHFANQGEERGEPARKVLASGLEEGGTTVILAAENDQGSILSPDALEFQDVLPESVSADSFHPR